MGDAVKRNILSAADAIVNSDRPAKYGAVTDSFPRIAAAFNATHPHGPFITGEDVAGLLVCMKLVRDGYSPSNPDHLTDAAGYIGLLDQIRQASSGIVLPPQGLDDGEPSAGDIGEP